VARRAGVGIESVFPYDYIVRSAEESLRNLKLDAIDLLQLHVWNPEWIDREEWRRAFEDLKRDGKIRAAGFSSPTTIRIRASASSAPASSTWSR